MKSSGDLLEECNKKNHPASILYRGRLVADIAHSWIYEWSRRGHVLCLCYEPIFEVKKAAAGGDRQPDKHCKKIMFYKKYNTTSKENQITCSICGAGVHSGTLCPKYRGLVHHKHCRECDYFISIMWKCRYRLTKKGDSNERTGNAENRKRKM